MGDIMEAINTKLIVKESETKSTGNVIKELNKIFWIFLIGSVIGYIVEMIVALVQNGHFESRQGLVIGPFTQVYGIGLVVYYLIVPHAKTNSQIFITSMILGGIVEYMFSYFQEHYFGTVSWDYSNLWFNLNGRTSLLHCIYWGMGGLLFMKFIYPYIQKIDKFYKNKYFRVTTLVLTVFMVFDIGLTTLATQRQLERQKNIAPSGVIDVIMDVHYPDEKLEEIYPNAKKK